VSAIEGIFNLLKWCCIIFINLSDSIGQCKWFISAPCLYVQKCKLVVSFRTATHCS